MMALEAAVSVQTSDTVLVSPPATNISNNESSTTDTTPALHDSSAFDDPGLWPLIPEPDWTEMSPPPPQPTHPPVIGRAALHLAAYDGNESMTKLLLESGADVARQDSSGCTPLHIAAEAGHETIIKILLENSADPKATDFLGRTVLFSAIKGGNDSAVRILLKEPTVDVNTKDVMGQVPLHIAVEKGSETIVRLLLKYGANIDA